MIDIWSDDCAISGLITHLISFSSRSYKINERSIVLKRPLALHVSISYLVTSSSDALRAISNRISAAAYYVGRASLNYRGY